MSQNIFDYTSYKNFIVAQVGSKGQRRGKRSALAKALNCQPTYISQILNGTLDLTLEQGNLCANFFGLINTEKHYFMLLLQKERAGNIELAKYFSDQINQISRDRMEIENRLGKRKALSKEDQSIYYSSWIYAAIHMAITIGKLQSKEALASFFNLPLSTVSKVILFLVETSLAEVDNQKIAPKISNLRIGRDSHNVLKHHMNWRTQAMESLDREQTLDLHYSSVFSLSSKDVPKIKELFLKSIEEYTNVVKNSPEEELYALCIDFFSTHK